MNNHDEIKGRRSLGLFLSSETELETLLGKMLLFSRDSEYFKFSGLCTAALRHYESNGNSIVAVLNEKGLITLKFDDESLKDALNHCEAVVGKTPEESFLFDP